jgi:ubiquinone/menaquinone biosynthesis C-methylase UbiE
MAFKFYEEVLFPWGMDRMMDKPHLAEIRKRVLSRARGRVLEIGLGAGLNLPHYPDSVRQITTIDSNPGMRKRVAKRIEASGMDIDFQVLNGETLPFDDESFDTVTCTWTLCSIVGVGKALGQIRRVLKPGGEFLFVEHGLSDEPKIQKWQRRLNGLQMAFACGCRLDRNMREIVGAADFEMIELKEYYTEKDPKTHGYMYEGVARKA